MELADALDFASSSHNGVLVTLKRDGRPQLSNISHAVVDGVIGISITDGRAKTKNLRRDPRASLYVSSPDFWSYVVLEGNAELTPVAAAPDDATVEQLVTLFRAVQGKEHPDWDEYRNAMVNDKRLIVWLRPTNAYGFTRAVRGGGRLRRITARALPPHRAVGEPKALERIGSHRHAVARHVGQAVPTACHRDRPLEVLVQVIGPLAHAPVE